MDQVVRLRIVNQPTHNYDLEMNQRFQVLADEAARVKLFTELPKHQQKTLIMAGRNDGARSIRRMVRTLNELADELPASAWD